MCATLTARSSPYSPRAQRRRLQLQTPVPLSAQCLPSRAQMVRAHPETPAHDSWLRTLPLSAALQRSPAQQHAHTRAQHLLHAQRHTFPSMCARAAHYPVMHPSPPNANSFEAFRQAPNTRPNHACLIPLRATRTPSVRISFSLYQRDART